MPLRLLLLSRCGPVPVLAELPLDQAGILPVYCLYTACVLPVQCLCTACILPVLQCVKQGCIHCDGIAVVLVMALPLCL